MMLSPSMRRLELLDAGRLGRARHAAMARAWSKRAHDAVKMQA